MQKGNTIHSNKIKFHLKRLSVLYSSSFRRTTTIVRQRSYINDFSNLNSGSVNCSDSRLTSVTRTLHVCFHLSQAKIIRHLCAILGSHLGCIRSVLLRTSKSHLTCRRPRDNLAFAVCQRNDNVVEGRMNVQLSISVHLYISFFSCDCFFCHINNYYLVAFFLFATVFFLPLRVRALFFVLWPRTGRPKR